MSRYRFPDTSDKRDDECWTDYWNRKRRERHGPDCRCVLCANEHVLADDHSFCWHTYENDPEVVGNDLG